MRIKFGKEQIVFIAILAALLILLLLQEQTYDALRYSREGLLSGEVWRIFSGHIVHLNIVHGLMNILALIIIVYSLGDALRLDEWCLYSALMAILTSLGLFIFSPHVVSYVGLSGILHGIFAMLVIIFALRESRLYGLLLLGLVVKITREQLPGFDIYHMSNLIDGAVIVDGHLYGTISGIVLAVLQLSLRYARDKKMADTH